MSFRICLGFMVFLVNGVAACNSDKANEHPPFCRDPECIPTLTSRGSASEGGADGLGVEPSSSGGSDSELVSVNGQIYELEEPSFFASTTATGTFTVTAPTTDGKTFDSDVSSIFALDGVSRSKAAWLSARAISASDLLPGLVGFDATLKQSIAIPMVHRSSLELVGSSLTTFTTLDLAKAQVVMRFLDVSGNAVTGITVAMSGAERVAYDLGAGYTDDAKGTSGRGLAFLFNVDASSTPAVRSVTLSGSVNGEFALWVQSGATTAVDIPVSKN